MLMRLLHSIKGKFIAAMRACGHKGDASHFGVRFPAHLAPNRAALASLDSQRFERAETLLVRRFLPRGSDVLELGGSMGVVSSVILGCGPRRLVSYEAVPELAAIGRQIVALNHPSADYLSVNRAICGEDTAEVVFYWSFELPLSGSTSDLSIAGMKEVRVPADTLAHACERHGFRPGAWLVCDVEGMEWDLLQKQADALRLFDGIIIECHTGTFGGRNRHQAEVESELAALGFRLRQRIGPVICMTR